MFGFGSPVKKLEKSYSQKLSEAQAAQRSGDMPEFARLSAEAEEIGKKLDAARSEASN